MQWSDRLCTFFPYGIPISEWPAQRYRDRYFNYSEYKQSFDTRGSNESGMYLRDHAGD